MAEIYLVDGSSIVYRSFYAIGKLETSTGIQTNAILGFFNTLFKFLKEYKIRYIGIFFDLKEPTLRHKKFQDYKIKRKPMPDELSSQIPVIKEILQLIGIKYFEIPGYEADDIIATFTEKFKKQHKVFIITGDKDALQLLDKNVKIINPANSEIKDIEYLKKKYNLTPEKITDLLALAGDTSDNIPGIPGIGEKTALKLLHQFSSLEELYENIEKVKSEKLKEKIIQNREIAFLSKELVKLHKNIDIEIKFENLKISSPDIGKLKEIFTRLEFKRLKEQLYKIFPEIEKETISEEKIAFSTGEIFEFNELVKNPENYKKSFENREVELYGFNLKSKLKDLYNKKIEVKNKVFDISLAEYLTGKVINDDIFKTVEKYKKIIKDMKMEYLYYEIELPLIEVLIWMENNGIKVNIEYLNELSKNIGEKLEKLENQIFLEAGEMFNINSPQQLSKILFEKLKLPPKKKLKTTYSTDTNVLQELSNIHPLPKLLLQFRELSKLKSTYVDGLLPFVKNGRIHPTFNQISTATGRLSCSNPNLQNIPIRTEIGSKIRKAFICEDNHYLFSFDYNQIELRILAHFSLDKYLVEAFVNGKDIHQETAEILFPHNSLFSPLRFKESDKKNLRRIAKTINFGVIYGISPYGLSRELNMPVEEASIFIKNYFEKFRGVKKYIEKTIKKVEKNGYVETIFGRRRYIPEIKSPNKNLKEFAKRAAINMPIQGTSADIIKLAMVKIYEEFKKSGLKSKMILQIHDELVFEVEKGEQEKVYKIVKNIMENCVKLDVPIKVDVKKGKNYLEMKKIS